jgi:hypothetical protein
MCICRLKKTSPLKRILLFSTTVVNVLDPEMHIFKSPGSGSISTDPAPSITKQKYEENLDLYSFATS